MRRQVRGGQRPAEPLAASLFERSIEVLREIGAENELGLSLAGYRRLQRARGDLSKAREFLRQAYEIFERPRGRAPAGTTAGAALTAWTVALPPPSPA